MVHLNTKLVIVIALTVNVEAVENRTTSRTSRDALALLREILSKYFSPLLTHHDSDLMKQKLLESFQHFCHYISRDPRGQLYLRKCSMVAANCEICGLPS
jgi:hypothetical protein